jgi:hypothetical protein
MVVLLRKGSADGDAWVKVIADLMENLPEHGTFHMDGRKEGILQTLASKCE